MKHSAPSEAGAARVQALLDEHRGRLEALREQLLGLNRKLNLVSPDTEGDFMERHVLHALLLAQRPFPPGAVVVDWGTGGGLPALPLAICFPEVTFHAVDSVGKKVQAVRTMARRLGVENLEAWHARAEAWEGQAHYSVSRATAPLARRGQWHRRARVSLIPGPSEAWPPGLLCLKGGDLREEVGALQAAFPETQVVQQELWPITRRAYYKEKVLLQVTDG